MSFLSNNTKMLKSNLTCVWYTSINNNYKVPLTLYLSYTNILIYLFLSSDATRIWESLSYDGHLRLIGGNHVTEGRVEILCNGQWGTVCDDALGREEARTMCRQLGYTDYVLYDHLIL